MSNCKVIREIRINNYLFVFLGMIFLAYGSNTFAWEHKPIKLQVTNNTDQTLYFVEGRTYQASPYQNYTTFTLKPSENITAHATFQWKDNGYDMDDEFDYNIYRCDPTITGNILGYFGKVSFKVVDRSVRDESLTVGLRNAQVSYMNNIYSIIQDSEGEESAIIETSVPLVMTIEGHQ